MILFEMSLYDRSSRPDVFCKKGVLRKFVKFTGKHFRQSLFFNKVVGLRAATFLKKRLWRRCFLVNFTKFLRTPVLQNTSGRLLLNLAQVELWAKVLWGNILTLRGWLTATLNMYLEAVKLKVDFFMDLLQFCKERTMYNRSFLLY